MVTSQLYIAQEHLRGLCDLLEQVLATSGKKGAALEELKTELEVLTQERDNALLRIEELERTHTDKWDRFDEHRGGVHPNA